MKEAILFDNDGVLVDTEPLYFQATREMCAQLGVELTLEAFIDCHIRSGCGTQGMLGLSDAAYAERRAWRNARYSELLQNGDHTRPGVAEVVAALAKTYRLGIVTSSRREHFDVIHRNSAYLRHIEFVVTLEDVSRSKPSPEPYQKGLSRLQLPPEACVVIEDSARGLQSALAAGIDCYLLKTALSPYLDLRGATAQLNTIADLPKAIRASMPST